MPPWRSWQIRSCPHQVCALFMPVVEDSTCRGEHALFGWGLPSCLLLACNPIPPGACLPVSPACPSAEERATQQAAFDAVSSLLQARWPGARVHLFGSVANGLSVRHNNDIDVCLELEGIELDDTVGGLWGCCWRGCETRKCEVQVGAERSC